MGNSYKFFNIVVVGSIGILLIVILVPLSFDTI